MIEERTVDGHKVQWDTELGGAIVQEVDTSPARIAPAVAAPAPSASVPRVPVPDAQLASVASGENVSIGPSAPAPADSSTSHTVTSDAPTS